MGVTITGADDNVSINQLIEISKKYPFVEWGILFSKTRIGTNRYPSREWIERLFKAKLKLAAHLCGEYATEICEKQKYSFARDYHYIFNRIQINYNKPWTYEAIENVKLIDDFPTKIILQVKEFRDDVPFQQLFDRSGGEGISPEEWPKQLKKFKCGYAGGIGPDNISEVLDKLYHVTDVPYWIDMETNVRTNDELDFDKVLKVLEVWEKYKTHDCL